MSLDDSLVFPGADGRAFLTPTVLLRRQLYPAMTRAGIPREGPTQEKRTLALVVVAGGVVVSLIYLQFD